MNKAKIETLGTPGAIESNAGDDYHILWACRRALRLLEPDSGLSLANVEGVSRDDETAAADPYAFLGVDLTEYYGGSSIANATRLVFPSLNTASAIRIGHGQLRVYAKTRKERETVPSLHVWHRPFLDFAKETRVTTS